MDSKTIVDRYEAKLEGQQFLWDDYDYILRHTNFKAIDPDFDREALVQWWMNAYVPDGYGEQATPYKVWDTWYNAMWKSFKHVRIHGIRPETNQSAIKFSAIKNMPLEPQVQELVMWLPHIKESLGVKGDKKGKCVNIFESTLSQHGVYSLMVYNETKFVIKRGFYDIIKEFSTLETAVDYIRHHLWYQKKEN